MIFFAFYLIFFFETPPPRFSLKLSFSFIRPVEFKFGFFVIEFLSKKPHFPFL